MKITAIILAVIFISGCFWQNRKIVFINQSDFVIDSVYIGAASADVYSVKTENVKPNDSFIITIPWGKPKSNKHDTDAFITIFIKGYTPISSNQYQDLSGHLLSDYRITLNKNKEIEWKIIR
jgi:hypothetical protein